MVTGEKVFNDAGCDLYVCSREKGEVKRYETQLFGTIAISSIIIGLRMGFLQPR